MSRANQKLSRIRRWLAIACFVAPLMSQDATALVLVGTITKIDGTNVTISALNNPTFTKTFQLRSTTQVMKGRNRADQTALTIGSVITVKQIRGTTDFETQRVDVLTSKP